MNENIQSELKRALSRRSFLRFSGGCAGLTSASVLSTMLQLKAINSAVAAAQPGNDYKALICLFLHGGYDSYNVLLPYDTQGYSDYKTIRSNLALDNDSEDPRKHLTPITDGPSGREFAVHKGLDPLATLYNEGNLAFVSNVGSLIERTDKSSYQQRQNLPLGLFSHSDLIRHWQTSVPQSRTQLTGWGGRMADVLTDSTNDHPTISMSLALNGINTFQTGNTVTPYVIQTSGATPLYGYGNGGSLNSVLTNATDKMLAQTYRDLFEKTHANIRRSSIDAAADFNAAVGEVDLDVEFPGSYIGRQLEMVAKTIASADKLGQRRQIFFVSRGGWDHHAGLIQNQSVMLPEIASALFAFQRQMESWTLSPQVTTFTASDFARTLSSNGKGSDHAWGGNHFVMGGAVNGTQVHGTYPDSLALGNPLDLGRGRLIPTTSVDEYAAELALWFGVQDSDLDAILPNIRNFYSSGAPVGFMS